MPQFPIYLHIVAAVFSTYSSFPLNLSFFISSTCVFLHSRPCVCVLYNCWGDPLLLPVCNPVSRLCECTEAEAEIVLQLKNELREKELKLTDIRLEALSSAHHLDQIREAMNRMQVRSRSPEKTQFKVVPTLQWASQFDACWTSAACNSFVSS